MKSLKLSKQPRRGRLPTGTAKMCHHDGVTQATPWTPCVLLKFGEISLRGRNRGRFVDRLEENTDAALSRLGVSLLRRGGLLVAVPERPDDLEQVLERAKRVFGVVLLNPSLRVAKDEEALLDAAVAVLRGRPGRTFAVRARRRDKRFLWTSDEIARRVGDRVRVDLGLKVDLTTPHLELHVEVDRQEIFVYADKVEGAGGLPVGSSGRALVLLSGGIDSPVAAFRAMRRGLHCDFIHFSGRPYTGAESTLKAYANAARLARYQGKERPRLFIVPFGQAQRTLATAGAGPLQVLAQRRLMIRTASTLARRERFGALVVGDSLGQVSSQTLHNMALVEEAATLPLLRPLVGFDKDEIKAEARRLGTLAVSELPDEDCCTLFASPRAETRVNRRQLLDLEGRVDLDEVVEGLLAASEVAYPRLAEEESGVEETTGAGASASARLAP